MLLQRGQAAELRVRPAGVPGREDWSCQPRHKVHLPREGDGLQSRQASRAGRWRRPGGGLESRLAWRWRRGQRGGRWLALGGSAFRAAGSRAAGRTSGACDPRESRSLLPWTGCMRFLDCFIFLKHQILFNSTETGQLLWAEPKLVVSQTKKLFPVIFV